MTPMLCTQRHVAMKGPKNIQFSWMDPSTCFFWAIFHLTMCHFELTDILLNLGGTIAIKMGGGGTSISIYAYSLLKLIKMFI